ncbi:MAG: fimbria/pilus periplasmic chaperone [Burkholderiaceae bacterium]
MKASIQHIAEALLWALFATPALGGVFSVSPVRIYMSPQERANAVTVVNEGDEPVVMQADLFAWRQSATGDDQLVPTEDLLLSPPIISLAPRARQVVRLARLVAMAPGEQTSYRMILREVVEARPKQGQQSVQVALAFSIPVFFTPPAAKRLVDCQAERSASRVSASCGNRGSAYAQPREFVLRGGDGSVWASRDSGGYILPGARRSFELKPAGPDVPADSSGTATLAVTFDDSVTEVFAVSVEP